MSGNGQVTNFPPTTQQNQICWVGVPNDDDLVMFLNSDLNNYAYIGYTPNLVVGVNTIPIAPNGSINLPANRTVYAIWSTTVGVSPLVVIPGGASYFLGLSQGLGNLAIPFLQSPNFISNVSGWQIDKNGNAQFNNLTIRGTFFGLDFIINNNGAFFYNGTPALGNLKISIVSNGGGTDSFGNVYLDNITAYNVAVAGGGHAQLAANPSTGIPFLVLLPPGLTSNSGPPQINAGAVNGGLVNEASQINVHSGFGTGPGSAGDAVLQLISEANDQSTNSIANVIAGQSQATKKDGNAYPIGHLLELGTGLPQTINSTSATGISGIAAVPVVAGIYKLYARVQFAGNQAAGTANFQFGTTAANTKPALTAEMHDTNVGTTNYTSRGALGPNTSPTLSTNAWWTSMSATVTFTGSGAVSLQAFCSVAADTFNITGAEFEVIPQF